LKTARLLNHDRDYGRSRIQAGDIRPLSMIKSPTTIEALTLAATQGGRKAASLGATCNKSSDCGRNALCVRCGIWKCCACPKETYKRDNPDCITRDEYERKTGMKLPPEPPEPKPAELVIYPPPSGDPNYIHLRQYLPEYVSGKRK